MPTPGITYQSAGAFSGAAPSYARSTASMIAPTSSAYKASQYEMTQAKAGPFAGGGGGASAGGGSTKQAAPGGGAADDGLILGLPMPAVIMAGVGLVLIAGLVAFKLSKRKKKKNPRRARTPRRGRVGVARRRRARR